MKLANETADAAEYRPLRFFRSSPEGSPADVWVDVEGRAVVTPHPQNLVNHSVLSCCGVASVFKGMTTREVVVFLEGRCRDELEAARPYGVRLTGEGR